MPSDHRLHATSILFSLAGSLKAFLLPAILLMLSSGRSADAPAAPGFGPGRWVGRWTPDVEIANWQFWLLLFLIPSTIAALARYFSFRIRYEGTELVIRSGILFRNERHVPYARIQNLDAVRNVAHRLLGVAEVRVETGGGLTPEATIRVLHETVFEEMRRRIFEGRARAGAADTERADTPATAAPAVESRMLLHLPLREVVLNGLLDNRGMLVVGAAYGVIWEAGLFRGFWDQLTRGAYGPGLVRDTVQTVAQGNVPSFARIAVLVAGIAGLLVLVRLLSVLWSWTRLHEFRLWRVGDDLRTEYGLLTRVTTTIPLRRVQTLTIREAPLQRLVGRMSVRVNTAGGVGSPEAGAKQPRESLAPIIRAAAVPALVREVMPGLEIDALEWQPLHPRALRRALKPAMLVACAVSAPFVGLAGWRGLAVLPLLMAWFGLATLKQVQHTRWASTEDVIAYRNGWLWRQLTVAPVAKIQTVVCAESPFDRRTAMANLRVDTAGGVAHRIAIPYLPRETARSLYRRLAAETARTDFRW
jgi:putative membrane protein